jgi:hypothetical protein
VTDDEADQLDQMARAYFARPDVAAKESAGYLAARQRAPEPPPATTIPMPEFPRRGVARFRCPRGCGWFHDEPTDPGPQPLIVPAGAGPDVIADMISLNAEARRLAQQDRIEAALRGHYEQAH